MRPTVVLFLWWRSRIFVYRKASSSTHCATSTFRTVFTRKSSNPRGFADWPKTLHGDGLTTLN